jgi:hypothetical protein
MTSSRPRGLALLSLLLVSTLLAPAIARAGIVVDGDAADWFGQLPPSDNTARIARRSDGAGELVWRDATGDARGSAAARACDLTQLRVSGDHDHLYLLARCAGPVTVAGDSAWQVQVSFDLNRFTGLGGTNFVGTDAAGVTPEAAWEYLVQTRFGSGLGARVVDPYGNEYVGAVAAVNASGVCEISVPWAALGFAFVPADPIRICAASFLSNASDDVLPAGDGNASRAADVVTQYALAGSGSTLTELADGVVDHSLDAYFDGRGSCISPIVVNEEFFEGGVNSQWLEIVNVSQSVLPLNQFKIGDAETPGVNEAMARFPSGTLLEPGNAFVVAFRGATFLSENGLRAGAECTSSDGGTPDMLPFTGWAPNIGFNIPNSGDAVLVLDRANTVVDVVTYKNASYPGVHARPAVPALHSLERNSPNVDTDDCATDFADRVTPTPSLVMQFTGVEDAAVTGSRWAGAWPLPSTGHVHLTLQLSEALGAGTRVELLDVSGRRVRELALPAHDMGRTTIEWDGRDSAGRAAAAGVYFARVRVAGRPLVQRLVIAR